MLKKLVRRLEGSHFWRKATFSEISALYTAKILRSVALNLVSTFILIYLYQSGYSLLYIAIFSAFRVLVSIIVTPLAAIMTAKMGAKKIILISNILYIPALICYANLSNEFAITLGGFLQSLAVMLYTVAHDVIFSEVKSEEKAGREISYMAIFEKVTAVLAPLLGGLLSAFVSPVTTIVLSSILFVISTIPLFQAQGVAKKQHFYNPTAFPLRKHFREMLSQISPGFDSVADKVWPIFLSIAVFTSHNPYLSSGLAGAISGVVATVTAFYIGKLLDRGRRHGFVIFNISAVLAGLGNIFKAFIKTPLGAMINIIFYDSADTSLGMSSLKAQFVLADRSGTRVTYLMYRHLAWNIFSFVASILWVLIMLVVPDGIVGMKLFLIIAGVFTGLYGLSGYWSDRV